MIDFGDCDVIECADESAWLKERNNGIGASEVAVLLGLSDWSSPAMMWAKKTGKVTEDASDAEYLEWGRFMEEPAAQRYTYRSGRALLDLGRFTILRSKKWPFLFATLDRIIPEISVRYDRLKPGADFNTAADYPRTGYGVCEIKAPTMYGFKKWDDGPPLDYQCQLQAQLAVTGWSWGSFAAQMPSGRFDIIDCDRQSDFIALMVEKCAAFWDCVQQDKWPPLDGSDWTAQAIKAIHPKDNGATVELPAEAKEWAMQIEAAKENIKSFEGIRSEAENKLRLAIGDATFGAVGDLKFSYKTQARKEHLVAASEFRVLRRVGK